MPTVAQLKAQLAAKGLPTDGVKAVLEARLAAAVPAAAAPAQVDVAHHQDEIRLLVRRRPPRSETPQLAKAFTVGRAVSA